MAEQIDLSLPSRHDAGGRFRPNRGSRRLTRFDVKPYQSAEDSISAKTLSFANWILSEPRIVIRGIRFRAETYHVQANCDSRDDVSLSLATLVCEPRQTQAQ
jgi:hypothetical protein